MTKEDKKRMTRKEMKNSEPGTQDEEGESVIT